MRNISVTRGPSPELRILWRWWGVQWCCNIQNVVRTEEPGRRNSPLVSWRLTGFWQSGPLQTILFTQPDGSAFGMHAAEIVNMVMLVGGGKIGMWTLWAFSLSWSFVRKSLYLELKYVCLLNSSPSFGKDAVITLEFSILQNSPSSANIWAEIFSNWSER